MNIHFLLGITSQLFRYFFQFVLAFHHPSFLRKKDQNNSFDSMKNFSKFINIFPPLNKYFTKYTAIFPNFNSYTTKKDA